jgi:hypothetical protein
MFNLIFHAGDDANPEMRLRNSNGTDTIKLCPGSGIITATKVYGAVWNDYAEMRNVPEIQKLMKPKQPCKNYEKPKRDIPMAGYCVYEVGDDTMALSTKRL